MENMIKSKKINMIEKEMNSAEKRIIQGQEIAEVGSTGNSTGPHLHFEIRVSEKVIDPQKILEL